MKWQPATRELMSKYKNSYLLRVNPTFIAKSTIKKLKNKGDTASFKSWIASSVIYPVVSNETFIWYVPWTAPSKRYSILILDETYWQQQQQN